MKEKNSYYKNIVRAVIALGKPSTIFEIEKYLGKKDEYSTVQTKCTDLVYSGYVKECGRRKCSVAVDKDVMQTYFLAKTVTTKELDKAIDNVKKNKKKKAPTMKIFKNIQNLVYMDNRPKYERYEEYGELMAKLKDILDKDIQK